MPKNYKEVQEWALHRGGGEEHGRLQGALGGGGVEVQAGAAEQQHCRAGVGADTGWGRCQFIHWLI